MAEEEGGDVMDTMTAAALALGALWTARATREVRPDSGLEWFVHDRLVQRKLVRS